MQDFVFMAVLVVFFVLAGLFVKACDRIIGPDDEALAEGSRGAPAPTPAPAPQTSDEKLAA
jgi:hypothetical protein